MRLGKLKLSVSPAFVLLLGVAVFLDEGGMLLALLPALLIHECGHALAFRLCGARVTGLNLSASGVSMDYAGSLTRTQKLLAALSGPALGLIFAYICSALGTALGSDALYMCAGLGLIINLFNLLPARPLDGGAAARSFLSLLFGEASAARVLGIMSTVISLAALLAGLYFITQLKGPALFFAGLWLCVFNCLSIVKTPAVV